MKQSQPAKVDSNRKPVNVRTAVLDDCGAIASLYLQVGRSSESELRGSGASLKSQPSDGHVQDDAVTRQRQRFEEMISGCQRLVLVAELPCDSASEKLGESQVVCGFITFGPSYTLEGYGEVMQLFVGPAWQRRGIGRALLDACIVEMVGHPWADAGMHVWASRGNPGNQIYERSGWECTGREKVITSTLAGEQVPVVEYRRKAESPFRRRPWAFAAIAVLVAVSVACWQLLIEISYPGVFKLSAIRSRIKDGPRRLIDLGSNVGVLFKVNPKSVGVIHAGCLDGSEPAYYYRPQPHGPNRTKWLLYFQGGGWCSLHEDAWPASFRPGLIEHCSERATKPLGSTKYDEPRKSLEYKLLFSQDPSINPTMHDWNVVLLRYCDGSSFASKSAQSAPAGHKNRTGRLHFEGLANLQAILSHLMRGTDTRIDVESNLGREIGVQDLSEATQVVVSGCSAGGVAAALHLERIRDMLPNALIVGLLDSAVFPDWHVLHTRQREVLTGELDRRPQNVWPLHEQLKIIFEQFGISTSVPRECLARNVRGPWRCFFLEHLLPVISKYIPVFVLQSRFDSSNIRRLHWGGISDFGQEVSRRLNASAGQFVNHRENDDLVPQGLFLDACFHHCMKWSEISIDGISAPAAFSAFMRTTEAWHHGRQAKVGAQEYWLQQVYDDMNLPCKDCCVSAAKESFLLNEETGSMDFGADLNERAAAGFKVDFEYWNRTFSDSQSDAS